MFTSTCKCCFICYGITVYFCVCFSYIFKTNCFSSNIFKQEKLTLSLFLFFVTVDNVMTKMEIRKMLERKRKKRQFFFYFFFTNN